MLDLESAIRDRAYQIWQAEGQVQGRDLDHWLRAEAETTAALIPAKAAKPRRAPAKPATAAKPKAGAKNKA